MWEKARGQSLEMQVGQGGGGSGGGVKSQECSQDDEELRLAASTLLEAQAESSQLVARYNDPDSHWRSLDYQR